MLISRHPVLYYRKDMYLWVTEEQGVNAVCFAVPRPTLARHKATIGFASDKSKASTPAAQHAEDDKDAASASQLAVQLRGGSHDRLTCLVCLGPVSRRSSQIPTTIKYSIAYL